MKTFVSCLFLLSCITANAGELYTFKDKDGTPLLTNVVDANEKPIPTIGDDGKPSFSEGQFDTLVSRTTYPDTKVHQYRPYCTPDPKKWTSTSIYGTYISKEATILTLKNSKRKFIETWVNNVTITQSNECSYDKQYLTIDCISKAAGGDWVSVTPADPDSDLYSVIRNICAAYPENKRKAKN